MVVLIIQPKWHYLVKGVGIHETQHLMAYRRVGYQVDVGEEEAILWACFIQIGEINAHLALNVWFFY